MRVLVTGAGGFIGGALVDGLLAHGHAVVTGRHRRPLARAGRVKTIAVDFEADVTPAAWLPRLAGVDAVVNTVGILRESGTNGFERLHHRAPVALFRACEQAGVKRFIQVSALGAEAGAVSAYHRSKQAADTALRGSSLDWTVVQPSLVFGPQGVSSRLFAALASLPVTPLVGNGGQQVQPVHIRDLVALIVRVLETGTAVHETVAVVGPRPLSLREWLATLRRGMGLPETASLPIPLGWIRLAAHIGDLTGHGALSSETLGMLQRGNTAPVQATETLLGRAPLDPVDFIDRTEAPVLRMLGVMAWWQPAIRFALALVWLGAGIVSALYASDLGPRLLVDLGLPAVLTGPLFATACAVDILLGLLTLLSPGRRLWIAQFLLVAFYSAALTVVAPALWQDPFGPLLKNLPILVVLLGLASMEPARRER